MVNKLLIPGLLAVMLCVAPMLHATQIGEKIPNFSIITVDGDAVDSDKIVGEKSLFLVFWATWCPNCKREIPHINELAKKFGSKGMEFLAVNVGVNDSEKKVRKYIKKYAMGYPVFFDKDSILTKGFKVTGTPTIIIADKNGIVRYRGVSPPEDLATHFADLNK